MAMVLQSAAVRRLAIAEGPVQHADVDGRAAAWAPALAALSDIRVPQAVPDDDPIRVVEK